MIRFLNIENITSILQSVFFEFSGQAPAIKTEAFCLDLTFQNTTVLSRDCRGCQKFLSGVLQRFSC